MPFMPLSIRLLVVVCGLLMGGPAVAQDKRGLGADVQDVTKAEADALSWGTPHNSQLVTVVGAVKRPGAYALKGRTSLLQLLAMSGGLDTMTSDSTVVVLRSTGGQGHAIRFDINDIRKGQVDDPTILPGDMVVANSSGLLGIAEGFGGRRRCPAAIQCN